MSLEDNTSVNPLFGNFFSADRLFRDLPAEAFSDLMRIKQKKAFPEGFPIYRAGEVPPGIYILLEGDAHFFRRTETGKKNIIRRIEPQEIIGLTETLADFPCKINAETVSPCVFELIESADLLRYLRAEPEVCFRLTQILADSLQKNFQIFSDL